MKKKKLKKRIKQLEEDVKFLRDNHFSSYDAWFDASKKYKSAIADFECLKTTIKTNLEEINRQMAVLRSRLDIDYTKFSTTFPIVDTSKGPDGAPLTCTTCKYNGLEVLSQDSPCFGCTKEDKKMYSPKEDSTNGN